MTEQREAIAAVLAPLAAPVLTVVLFALPAKSLPSYHDLPGIVFPAVIVSYLGFFLVGLPVVFLLRRLRLLNLPALIVCGALSGVIVFSIFEVLLSVLLGTIEYFRLTVSGAIWGASIGAGVAALFGSIAGITWRSSGTPQKRGAP